MAVPTVSIKGNSYSAFPGSAALADGIYYCHPGGPGIGGKPYFSGEAPMEAEHIFPTVPGIGRTRFSTFGHCNAVVDLAFVQATAPLAEAAYDSLSSVANLAQLARYNITF